MASAAAAYLMGGSPRQCECAAEIGLEHFLGLTCESTCFLGFLLSVYRFDLSGVDSGLCFFDCCLGSYAGLFLSLSCCNLCIFFGLLESCELGSFLSLLVCKECCFLSLLGECSCFFCLSNSSLCFFACLEGSGL
jgi:hypothetical protein